MAIDILIIGSRSNVLIGLLKTLTMLVYFVVLPCTFLVNCSAGVNAIVDENWLVALARLFRPIREKDGKESPKGSTKFKPSSNVERSSVFKISNGGADSSALSKNTIWKKPNIGPKYLKISPWTLTPCKPVCSDNTPSVSITSNGSMVSTAWSSNTTRKK